MGDGSKELNAVISKALYAALEEVGEDVFYSTSFFVSKRRIAESKKAA
ncbi:hypothetical protein [Pseudovibrio sp. POLY-S9]|nr:hypothetical protein [Pseudovibrio sp. POLY-S9]